jgi:putative phosphoesterase
MRVAALYDVHANLPAVEAVLAEVDVDTILVGGDAVLGPMPKETLRLLRDRGATFIRGNCDREVATPGEGEELWTRRARWAHEQLDDEELAFLRDLRHPLPMEVDGLGEVLFCHGSPRSDEELITPATPSERMRELLADVPERILVSAHTHVQFDRFVDGVRSVNPGSVGMPYQGASGAYWAILGPDVQLCRTEYDLDVAIARYRGSNDPLVDAMVKTLVEPPTLGEVIANAEALEFSV